MVKQDVIVGSVVVLAVAVPLGVAYWQRTHPTAEESNLVVQTVKYLKSGRWSGIKNYADRSFLVYLSGGQYNKRLIKDVGTVGGLKGIWNRWANKYGDNLRVRVLPHHYACNVSDEKGMVVFMIHPRIGTQSPYLTQAITTISTDKY